MRRFGRILVARYPTGHGPDNRLFLAVIWDQEDGPVNLQRSARDFLMTKGTSWPTHRQSRWPSTWSLIAAKDASILAHFSRPDIGMGMDPEAGYT